MKSNKLFEIIINRLLSCSSVTLIFVVTLFVLVGSIPAVYALSTFFDKEYTIFLFSISIILPMLLTPLVVLFFIKITKHLKYFKDHLEEELEKNKEKDILLFEQARFVLMGEMMANISHQWKQPLNTIGLATVGARMSKCNEKNLEKNFDIIEDNIGYLATTIDDFMSFFDKRTHSEIRTLPSIVKEIKSIIQTQIENQNIELEIDVEYSAQYIMIVSSISQVVLNILNNAKDAFSDEMKDKKITLSFEVNNNSLEIKCVDNGKGIHKDIEDKIFDPYFTTKEKSQGTGIGLYMSKQIVQKLFSGSISINSARNYNQACKNRTCFNIYLPYSDKCVLKEVK